MAAQGTEVQNVGGPLGAKVSQWLFADGLGAGAFVIALWLGLVAAGLLGWMKINFWSLTAKCLFSAISLSIVLGLVFYGTNTYVHWGGAHGREVNTWLFSVGNVLLAVGVSVCLVGIAACIYINELTAAYRSVSGAVAKRRDEWRRMRAEDRARRNKLAEVEPAEEYEGFTGMQEPEQKTESRDLNDRPGAPRDPLKEEREIPESDRDTEAAEYAEEPAPAPHLADRGFDIDDINDIEDDEDLPDDDPEEETAGQYESPAGDDDDSAEENTVATDSEGTEFVVRAADTDDGAFPIDEDDEAPRTAADVLASDPYDPRAELSHFRFPDVDLLIARESAPVVDMEEQTANKDLIVKTLLDYKIPIERIEATVGPTVTLYEVKPAEGVRIAQIKRLEDDIALSLSALGIRIIAPIPGKDVVGIEVPNRDPQIVSIRNVFASRKFRECNMRLPMAMGATISNDIFIADLAKMPHLLVAGATGQGKSVGLNCILASLLYKKHPAELKFVLIDPKMVEFSLYSKLERHYIAKLPDEEEAIVTDPLKAAATLHSLCIEMDNRYQLLRQAQVRNLEEYNDKFMKRRLNPEHGHRFMPYIVMVVDEFADLIMQAGKEVSLSIARIAQKARAVGMHMIIATQRPSTDVISGMIKNNFPGRIAFKVSQMVDSRTILDSPGANRLIGRGDMLFSHNSVMTRVQCALIETEEVEAIVEHINDQMGYSEPYLLPEIPQEGGGAGDMSGMVDLSKRDAMFDQCARFIVTQSTASTSMLQRRFGIGYNKAGKIMDQMEAAGIVGPACGAKPRAILVDGITVEEIINNNA
ncbi:MAG: DNA translocase FtsK [Muribaculaceae bacterium]|nr:DNA translocase FtsK [Muribaculaceae bacterium]